MVYYYLDLETYGKGERPDPEKDEIITITYCAIDPNTGHPTQEPNTLKAWQSSEESIVQSIAERMLKGPSFDFVPIGFAILYDLWFLKHKFRKYLGVDIDDAFYLNQPYIDLKQVMVFAEGRFKGVRLGIPDNPIRDWYEYGDYESIERHTLEKFERFCDEWGTWKEKLS